MAEKGSQSLEGTRQKARRRGLRRGDKAQKVRRRKRTGEIALLDSGKQPLWELGEEWWRLHARRNLAPTTLELYAMLWNTYILPRLCGLALAELTPERLHGCCPSSHVTLPKKAIAGESVTATTRGILRAGLDPP